MIVDKSKSAAAFKDLPGLAAIVGGVWLTILDTGDLISI